MQPGDPNQNPNPTVIAGIVTKIKEMIGKLEGKCDQFAIQFTQKLEQLGITFKIIRVDSASGIIYSDKYGEIGRNGYHYGIQIGNLIFDNMNLTGMKCETWLFDLGVGQVADMTAKYVIEILSH